MTIFHGIRAAAAVGRLVALRYKLLFGPDADRRIDRTYNNGVKDKEDGSFERHVLGGGRFDPRIFSRLTRWA